MLQSLFNNQMPGYNSDMTSIWQAPQTPTTSNTNTINGVKYNRPNGGYSEETPMGQSPWHQFFTGLDLLGEGQTVDFTNVQPLGNPNDPSGFTIWRAHPDDPTGSGNLYQTRQLGINPDGSVYWSDGDWQSKTQTSQMDHFLQAGLPMALAMAGGISALGSGAGASGLSGMDLAADAALGSGNNIFTAGQALGGASAAGAAGGLGAMTNATNPALIESAVGTPGYGLSSAGAGAATGGGAMDILKGLGKSLIGGQSGGISNLGNLASLFTNYKQYSNTGDLMDQIKGIYSPDGVYAKELEQQLARRDAAAGRNSQYGPRLAELMARLGDSQARSLSGLGGMMNTQQGGLNGMVGAGSRLLESTGALEKLFSIFGD